MASTLPNIFIELLSGKGNTGSISISILLCIALFLLFRVNYPKTMDFFERFRERQFTRLEKYVGDSTIDENVRNVAMDIRSGYAFERATGIYGERKYRQVLIEFYQELEQKKYFVTWLKIKRVREFLKLENNKIEIQVKWIDCLYFGQSILSALFMLFMSGYCFFIAFNSKAPAISKIEFLASGFVAMFITIYFYYQTLPYTTAKAMKASLEEKKKNAQQEIQTSTKAV